MKEIEITAAAGAEATTIKLAPSDAKPNFLADGKALAAELFEKLPAITASVLTNELQRLCQTKGVAGA